jgi:hypothetical protein
VHPPELAGLHCGPGGGEGRVEATGIAHLHRDVALVHVPGDGDGLRQVGRQRLLAEHGDARIDAGPDQPGVGGGRRGDDDAVDTVGDELIRGVSGVRAHELGDRRGDRGDGIRDDERVDGGEAGQGAGVEGADPAEADQAQAHGVLLRWGAVTDGRSGGSVIRGHR